MDSRELGLVEVYERIKAKRSEIGLLTFKRTPTKPLDPKNTPLCVMLEDEDNIIKRSSRGVSPYPAVRRLEVHLEIICNETTHQVKPMYSLLRKAVFTNRDAINPQIDFRVAKGVTVSESRSEGPYPYGVPNLIGMRLILNLEYTDEGV